MVSTGSTTRTDGLTTAANHAYFQEIQMVILTLNCGSSSAKYQVYDWDNRDVLATGVVERITAAGSCITHKPKGKDKFCHESP